jgi:hypothetical protein
MSTNIKGQSVRPNDAKPNVRCLLSKSDKQLHENYQLQQGSGGDTIYLSAKEWERIPKILKLVNGS